MKSISDKDESLEALTLLSKEIAVMRGYTRALKRILGTDDLKEIEAMFQPSIPQQTFTAVFFKDTGNSPPNCNCPLAIFPFSDHAMNWAKDTYPNYHSQRFEFRPIKSLGIIYGTPPTKN